MLFDSLSPSECSWIYIKSRTKHCWHIVFVVPWIRIDFVPRTLVIEFLDFSLLFFCDVLLHVRALFVHIYDGRLPTSYKYELNKTIDWWKPSGGPWLQCRDGRVIWINLFSFSLNRIKNGVCRRACIYLKWRKKIWAKLALCQSTTSFLLPLLLLIALKRTFFAFGFHIVSALEWELDLERQVLESKTNRSRLGFTAF